MSEEIAAADSLLHTNADLRSEIARLHEQLDDVMRAGDMEHNRNVGYLERTQQAEAMVARLQKERDDLAAHFDVARARGDKYLGKIGHARLLLKHIAEGGLIEAIHTLLAELARLQTALAWYADVSNYDDAFAPGTLDPQDGTWHIDCGSRARAALKGSWELGDRDRGSDSQPPTPIS